MDYGFVNCMLSEWIETEGLMSMTDFEGLYCMGGEL